MKPQTDNVTSGTPGDPRPALVLDFDGTMTTCDVGDAVCDRFAPPAWREIDERWLRRELSLPDAQRQMWALTRATRAEVEAFVGHIAVPRRGLSDLVTAARSRGYRIVVASGGFDFCMEPILRTLPPPDAVHCNGADFTGDRIVPRFNAEGLSCGSCAVCKGRVCERERGRGARRVVFVGDGSSDRCALGRADVVAAVRGGHLAAAAAQAGVPVVPFEDLAALIPLLD